MEARSPTSPPMPRTPPSGARWLFLGNPGGHSIADFEGLLDEAALYDRALDPAEIAAHVRAAGAR